MCAQFFLLVSNFLQDCVLGRLQQGVEAAQNDHRQDDVAILASDVDVSQAVISNSPDERDQ